MSNAPRHLACVAVQPARREAGAMMFIAGFFVGASTVIGGFVIAACVVWKDMNT